MKIPADRFSSTICLLSLLLFFAAGVPANATLEPMDEVEMAGVSAQAGIAVAMDDVLTYTKTDYIAYQDTTGFNNRIALENTSALVEISTRWPLIFRVFETQDGLPIVALEAFSADDGPAWQQNMIIDTESLIFQVEGAPEPFYDLGGLRLKAQLPVDAWDVGFMEEFAVYATPLENIAGYAGQGGIGFQLEARTGFDEFIWNYSEAGGEFRIGGFKMVDFFDNPLTDDHTDPATWAPEGRFVIGSLDVRDQGDTIRPATFQVVEDAGGGVLRMNLPMQGSIRIEEVGMTDLSNNKMGFGPIIIDGLDVHRLQVDFLP
jgi:hypothetical protein